MTAMTPGSNVPLTASRVTVEVTAPVALDVSGLLLTADGKVRSDDDFVFSHQPSGTGVRYEGGAIVVDTAAVPDGIERVVVTAGPGERGRTFAGNEPTATVRNSSDGTVVATFTPAALGAETALVVVEVYRRGAAWKLRAVGQGYADGPAGIAADFGVTVRSPPTPPEPTRPTAPPPLPVTVPAPAVAPLAAPPVGGTARVNLDKGRVSLRKGQSVSLVKGGRPLLSRVRMGLGWEPARHGRAIDLDASVIAYGSRHEHLDSCYFGKKRILGGAIRHSGDNVTGRGAGDDETITVDLGGLPADATALVFTVNSYSGQKFTHVTNAYCRLIDDASGEELVRFDLTHSEDRTGVLMCKLVKQPAGEWEMTGLGGFATSRTVRGMVEPGSAAL